MDLLRINVSKIVLVIGSAIVMYGIVNPTLLFSRWDASYQYLFLGGSISTIGLIFMFINSIERKIIVSS